MSVRAPRSHADVRDMRHGHYTRSHTTVWYRCTACGETNEIGTHDYGISLAGDVRPAFVCPVEGCEAEVVLRLEDWTPFDVGGGA